MPPGAQALHLRRSTLGFGLSCGGDGRVGHFDAMRMGGGGR